MTDDEKHEWCRKRGAPSALFLPEPLYREAERQGYDMRYYVIQKPIPISSYPPRNTKMHEAALQEVIRICRQREREGDCPTVKAFPVETLENAVIQLADRLKIVLDPDTESDAGVAHWEAPR